MPDMEGLHFRHISHIGHMYGPPTSLMSRNHCPFTKPTKRTACWSTACQWVRQIYLTGGKMTFPAYHFCWSFAMKCSPRPPCPGLQKKELPLAGSPGPPWRLEWAGSASESEDLKRAGALTPLGQKSTSWIIIWTASGNLTLSTMIKRTALTVSPSGIVTGCTGTGYLVHTGTY